MVMAASGLKSQSAYDHCQQRFHMLPLIRDVPSLGRCYSCIMVNWRSHCRRQLRRCLYPGIVVGFQVEGTGAIGIDRNTRVDVGIERFIERDRGIIAVG